jgi:hypothetical protein
MIVGGALVGGTKTGRLITNTCVKMYGVADKENFKIDPKKFVGQFKDTFNNMMAGTINAVTDTKTGDKNNNSSIDVKDYLPKEYKFTSKNNNMYFLWIGAINKPDALGKYKKFLGDKAGNKYILNTIETEVNTIEAKLNSKDEYTILLNLRRSLEAKFNDAGLFVYHLDML